MGRHTYKIQYKARDMTKERTVDTILHPQHLTRRTFLQSVLTPRYRYHQFELYTFQQPQQQLLWYEIQDSIDHYG